MTDVTSGRPPAIALPAPIKATIDDLPPAVAAALGAPAAGRSMRVEAAGLSFAAESWGEPSDAPLLLLHGITSGTSAWWRFGPALAAAGWLAVAVDLPGHGLTTGWTGRHRFRETAEDLDAFARAAGLARPDLAVIGHSWGSMVSAELPAAGLRPDVLVLLDPPAVPLSVMTLMLDDPVERLYPTLAEAVEVIGSLNPTWPYGDVVAKADGLTRFNLEAVRAILTRNGDWDAGLTALSDPAADGVPVRIVRGEPVAGSLTLDAIIPALAARVGGEHILTIAGGPHSPQRTHPEATLVALLRALEA